MHIAPAAPEDVPEIASVHVRSWQAAYAGVLSVEFLDGLSVERRAAAWRDILAAGESTTLVAHDGSGICGFVGFGHWREEAGAADHGEIWALYARPEAWGSGVGRALLQRAVRALHAEGRTTVSLWVLARNARGIRFYQGCGFRPVEGSSKVFELGGRPVEEVCLRLGPDAAARVEAGAG